MVAAAAAQDCVSQTRAWQCGFSWGGVAAEVNELDVAMARLRDGLACDQALAIDQHGDLEHDV